MNKDEPAFGVYIHWPFCAQKCPYCDFNSHVRFGGWDEPRYLAAYKRELDHVAALIADAPREARPRTVSSIFFGGGTPSLMKPETVGAILDHIAHLWPVDPNAEITLEANPGSVEAARFAGYRTAGVDRVSIGVQSLRDADLKRLGRIHSVDEAKAAIEIARRTFDRFSFDLIYARPEQTLSGWRTELSEALEIAGHHLSLYQLTIEPETRFADLYAKGRLVIPPAEAAHDLYEATQELTAKAGLRQYEISNHACPGEESRHNLLYWRYGEYAGIGPGAHGRIETATGHLATSTERSPERWLARVEKAGHGITETEELSPEARADEMLLMGLRLEEGIDLDRLARIGGLVPRAFVVSKLIEQGLIERLPAPDITPEGLDEIRACLGPGLLPSLVPAAAYGARLGRIRASGSGRFILNSLVLELSASFEPATHPASPR
ncbi:radical SAM family heme chaperone HemW [Hyphomicrobium sp.]|uniref:radical SAM family heme chaperone HemW n=1 Tax=Hyphomicrobium sp. TaxID=82 RepID=UPI002E30F9D6|nr:radical SAM family heme chaperone HemW [Hyphomicrobium sp.]HEX2841625.1 radical SAM family heme chaperone HemW [Hyphomicrobium sp.]